MDPELTDEQKRNCNTQPVMHIDATPDADYPIRILEAYRQHCDCWWSTDLVGGGNVLSEFLNGLQVQRANILDDAIDALRARRLRDGH